MSECVITTDTDSTVGELAVPPEVPEQTAEYKNGGKTRSAKQYPADAVKGDTCASHRPVEGRERPLGAHLRPVWFWLSCHVDIWKQNENRCHDVIQQLVINRKHYEYESLQQ